MNKNKEQRSEEKEARLLEEVRAVRFLSEEALLDRVEVHRRVGQRIQRIPVPLVLYQQLDLIILLLRCGCCGG